MYKKNGHIYLSFPYDTDLNDDVIVEIYAWYQEPDINNTSSDWDFYGGFTIDDVKIYKDNKIIRDNIPYEILEEKLRDYLRNLDIQDSWDNEKNLCF